MAAALRSSSGPGGHRDPVIYIAGYDSSYDGSHPGVRSPGLVYQIYSYRGLVRYDRPRRYTAVNTHQSLARSARLLAAQVQVLHKATGRPVGIVAESEASWAPARICCGRGTRRWTRWCYSAR